MTSLSTRILPIIVFTAFLMSAATALADSGSSLSWTMQTIGLLGGMAFFIYGMELMSIGMKRAAGNRLRGILLSLTGDRFRATLLGVVVTMVIQSGGAVTVMLVSFVQAGLMPFSQTIGVLLGAGIGKTFTVQLIAFKVTDYALLFIALGCLIRLATRKEGIKSVAEVILGFGILFYGLNLMGSSMAPLGKSPEVTGFIGKLDNPFIGLAIGTALTALIQSSTAFISILIILGHSGVITSLNTMIPMILGANIGTCITAGIASIGTNREAKRVAMANFLIRVIGALLFFVYVPQFSALVRNIDARFQAGIVRQIANVHTIFNVALAFIFLPFTDRISRLIMKIMPDKPAEEEARFTTFLDESMILSTVIAIDLARAETSRMAGTLEKMLRSIAIPFVTKEEKRDKTNPKLTLMEGIDRMEEELDFLEEKIVNYLIRVAQLSTNEERTRVAYAMISIVKDMESIGDIIHRNVVPLVAKKRALQHDFSPEGKEELTIYHQKVIKQIRLLKEAFSEKNLEKAQSIMGKERKYLDLELQYRIRHLNRLVGHRLDSLETHEIHMELMNLMSQIIVYTSNIAKTFLQTEVQDKPLLI